MNTSYSQLPDQATRSSVEIIPQDNTSRLLSIAAESARKLAQSTLPGHVLGTMIKLPTAATKALYAGATCLENRSDQILVRELDVRDVQCSFVRNLALLKSGEPPAWRSAYHYLRRYPDRASGRELVDMMRAANERLDTDFFEAVTHYAKRGKELVDADDHRADECVKVR